MSTRHESRSAYIKSQRNKYMSMYGRLPGTASPNRALAVRSPSRSPNRANSVQSRAGSVNLYGGPRGATLVHKRLRAGQVRSIILVIISILIALAVERKARGLSGNNARKYGVYVLGIFKRFLAIVKYFAGYERHIEAGAAAIATVIARKMTSGNMRLNKSNLFMGVGAYSMAYSTRSGFSNFVNHMNKRSNSYFQIPGTQLALNEKIRASLITMLAWMISSLNFFAVSNAWDILKAELQIRGITRMNQSSLANAGRNTLRMT